ncbi:MAG: hypothetical protein HC822_16415 [Oscillochloris sp.]|nr:hypothetical protein [Oscillochloris sp.]
MLETLHHMLSTITSEQETQVPYTTFHLYAGRDIGGRLLDLAEEQGRTVVLVQTAASAAAPTHDICYFDAAEIQAITVHNALAAPKSEEEDVIALTVGEHVASCSELYAQALEYGRRLSEMVDGSLTIKVDLPESADDRTRYRLASGMEQTVLGLQRLIASQLGQAAINTIQAVKIIAGGTRASADIESGMLLLKLGNGPIPNAQSLRRLIMAAL